MIQFYNECLLKQNLPTDLFIEKQSIGILHDFILFEEEKTDDDSDDEPIPLKRKRRKSIESQDQEIPPYPNEQYKWEERVDSLGINPILESIKIRESEEETLYNEKIMNLRKKFWDDYLSQRKNFKHDKDFVRMWCSRRNDVITEGELSMKQSSALKLLAQFKAYEGVICTKERPGV